MMKIFKHHKSNQKGFSLVELTVAMAILSLFMPAIVGMMSTALNASKSVSTISSNTVNTAAIENSLQSDMKDAVAMSVNSSDSTNLKLALSNGSCKDWKIDPKTHRIYTKTSTGKITISSSEKYEKWDTGFETTVNEGSTPAFSGNSTKVIYNLVLGTDENSKVISGELVPTNEVQSPGKCW